MIKAAAAELGFDIVGIAKAEPLDVEGARFMNWLAGGFHGEMKWLGREPEMRTDPRSIFPEARSVVVVALNYYTPYEHLSEGNKGKISRYAWGDDYHEVIGERLRKLLDLIVSEVPGAKGKICVDTAPMMDKAWAVRAGIGWLGKHSNVITTEVGSWIFIGELLLDVELEADTDLVPDHCGSCTACIDACPTKAIVDPYVVDSRKCISYATIELRDEELPDAIVPHLDGWLYGCDICQEVCPWNRFEKPSNESAFEPRYGETSLDLDSIADMSHDEYVDRFRRSAIKRTKLSGLKRNAKHLKKRRL